MNLTARTYVVLAVVCIAGVAEQWAGGEVGWWRYGIALLLLGLAYEWTQVRLATVNARLSEQRPLQLGRLAEVEVEFLNSGSRAVMMQYVLDLPLAVDTQRDVGMVEVQPNRVSRITQQVRALELGEHQWNELAARLRGSLGLGWWQASVPLSSVLRVTPDGSGRRDRVLGEQISGSQASRPGAGQELHHLRDYERGDPLHTIDWKASARSQQLITRVFAEDQHLEIVLVLDIGRTSRTEVDGLSQFGHYVNLTARFAEHAVAQGDEIGLVAVADNVACSLAPAGGAGAVRNVRKQLERLQTVPVETDLVGAALHVHKLVQRRALVILLTDLYGQSIEGSFGDALKLWRQKHLAVVVGLIGADVTALAQQPAAEARDVFVSLASREYGETLEHNASAAQRMGAHAVVCRPGVLEARVFSAYRLLKTQRRV